MALRDTDFPAWLQEDGTLLWAVPLTGANTQLRYGKFSRLFIQTLRPARDAADEPVLGFTKDGAIRGQVMMGSGPRHVDVYAKRRQGTRAELEVWHPSRRDVEDTDELRFAHLRAEVQDVRAQRLADVLEVPPMLELAPGTNWNKPEVKRVSAAIAGALWDRMIADFRPTPRRFSWANNPWIWIHRCRRLP